MRRGIAFTRNHRVNVQTKPGKLSNFLNKIAAFSC